MIALDYEALLQEANDSNVHVIEKAAFRSESKGLIKNDVIGLNRNIETDVERACVLAEELGHYYTTAGDIIDMSDTSNRKQERRARLWAYNKLIGLRGIISAYNARCSNRYETAKHLGITEEFMTEAIEAYAQVYGSCVTIDNYIIFFTPTLGVIELI